MNTDPLHAFCEFADVTLAGAEGGPLQGLTFAAKDLIDVAGHITGGGNPDWLRSHGAAKANAWVVDQLVQAGATLVGKTHTDEISLGILGENVHYGTPTNPKAPDRVPGGSSSGSAAAVAGGLVDFALGTDTGGSVRVPASFCGIYGLRPSHDRVSFQGVMAQAPGFDTVGWLAHTADLMAQVGAILLQSPISDRLPGRIILAEDAFEIADPEVVVALEPAMTRISAVLGQIERRRIYDGDLQEWQQAQRTLQRGEMWHTFKDWVDRVNPRFAFNVAQGMTTAAQLQPEQILTAQQVQSQVKQILGDLMQEDGVILMPTTPGIAPLRGLPLSAANAMRQRLSRLNCIAGIAGLPQISLPMASVQGCPVGISLLGPRGGDELLLAAAQAIAV